LREGLGTGPRVYYLTVHDQPENAEVS
jgi:hypothetical protein